MLPSLSRVLTVTVLPNAIMGFDHQQIVVVVGDKALGAHRVGMERIASSDAAGRNERGLSEFFRCCAGLRMGRQEHSARGNPPTTIPIQIDVSAAIGALSDQRFDQKDVGRVRQ